MIHVFLGTKAQLIKMAPIMVLLQQRGIEYNFIFSGQHQDTINELRENFGVKKPDITLHEGSDINSIPKMFFWLMKVIVRSLLKGRAIWQGDKKGIVLNHGDTFSTLLGSILAKLYGHKNAHVESGLRSHNIFHPFPEELTRLLVFRLTDIYFAPGQWALDNLTKYRGIKVNTQGNTLYDSLMMIKDKPIPKELEIPQEPYAVVTLHRFENLYDRKKLEMLVKTLVSMSRNIRLLFIQHSPTKRKLERYDLMKLLISTKNIELRPRYDYLTFIHLIQKSEFVVSDGGSNQEECYYLGKPCLLFRKATERQEGLEENVLLSKYDKHKFEIFCNNYTKYIRKNIYISPSPATTITDSISAP